MRGRVPGFAVAALQLVCALVLGASAWAQRYHVHTYTEGDGLPSSRVHGVTQDSLGRMWFATGGGLASYDGKDWNRPDGLVHARWRFLAVDDDGLPWAAAMDFEVARFDGECWILLPRARSAGRYRVAGLAVAGRGYHARVALATGDGVELWEDGEWRRIGVEAGLPDPVVSTLTWRGDELYIGTEGGLVVLEAGAERAEPPGLALPGGPVRGLVPGPEAEGLWIVGSDWIALLEGGEVQVLAEGIAPEVARASAAEADGTGGLLIGDSATLRHVSPGRGLEILDESNGLINVGAEDVFLDREGNVWVASLRGLSKIVSFRFATYRAEHGLFEDEVTAVLERRSGELVLGHRGGLTVLGPEGMRTIDLGGRVRIEPDRRRVLDLAEQASGTVWVAGNSLGLGRLVGDEVLWSGTSSTRFTTSVLVDREDHVWVARGHDVLRDRGAGLESVLGEHFGHSSMRRLVEGEGGVLYALTGNNGLLRHSEGQWQRWRSSENQDLNSVYSILERSDDALWVGTDAGLAEVRDGALVRTRSPAPVVDRPVYFMLTDTDDRVWFGCDNGVLRWDGARLEHFSAEDGVGGRETNRAAGVVDSEGRIWIGTEHGVTLYRKELDRRLPVAPRLSLTSFQASGRSLPLGAPLRLSSGAQDLAFAFQAISLSDERGVRFRSWLEGHEPDWSAGFASSDRRVQYRSVPPGQYRFHIQAGTRAGAWSEVVSSEEIVIPGPVWSRTWFHLTAAALAGLLLFAVHRHMYQRRYARSLETEVTKRVAELRRTQDELTRAQRLEALGLLAGGIAHDFNNLLTVILGNLSLIGQDADEEQVKSISDAESAIDRAHHLADQLMTFSRGGAPVRKASRLSDLVRDTVSFVLSGSAVRCEVELSDEYVVDIDAGQISRVITNLLINAAEAMPDGGVISITGERVARIPGHDQASRGPYIALYVRDSGVGIPRDDLQRVFDPYFSTKSIGNGLGLAVSESIVRKHGGMLTVESEPHRGTTFTAYLPASDKGIEAAPAPSEHLRFEGVSVLVMDDEPAVRHALATVLRSLGCTVTATADGAEALWRHDEAVEAGNPFSVLVLDLTVPGGMGGAEVMRRLRGSDREVRAIVCSGYSHDSMMAEHREFGFRSSVGKPFRQEDLAEALLLALEPELLRQPS